MIGKVKTVLCILPLKFSSKLKKSKFACCFSSLDIWNIVSKLKVLNGLALHNLGTQVDLTWFGFVNRMKMMDDAAFPRKENVTLVG